MNPLPHSAYLDGTQSAQRQTNALLNLQKFSKESYSSKSKALPFYQLNRMQNSFQEEQI